ncbi:MAG: hypothetical protein GY711_35280 [bacterium]|nr:hypothetical protein [bacterium]
MHRLALIVLLLLLALVVAFVVDTGSREETLNPAADSAEPKGEARPALQRVADAPVVREREALTEQEGRADSSETSAAPSTDTVELSGTWTVLDAEDQEHRGEDGRFVLRLYEPREDIEISVRGGAWSVALAPGAGFDLRELELGGRVTEPLENVGDLEVPPSRRLDLTARWVRPVVLKVVDAETRVELAGITVIRPLGAGAWLHPGETDGLETNEVLARDARSPVELPVERAMSNRESLWVRAPGYGWGHVEVPRTVGGEFLVPLGAGGDLEIEVVGVPEGTSPHVRLRDPKGVEREREWEHVLFETEVAGRSRLDLAALAAGRYRAALELGHRYRRPRELAGEEVEVRAGQTAAVRLDASTYAPPAVATMSGRVTLPTAWKLDSFGVHFNLIGEPSVDGSPQRYLPSSAMEQVDIERGEYAFRMAELQCGRWELRFNPLGTSVAVTLPPEGLHGVELIVPPPAEVTVRVTEAGTGTPIADVDVHYMPDRTGLTSGGVLNGAGARGDGTFHFRTPAGRVDVWVISDTWRFRREGFDVPPGTSEVTIETERACGVVLKVRDAGTLLRVDAFAPRILGGGANAGEQGALIDEDGPGLELRYVVPAPGAWRVELTSPAGYAPVEPVELEVGPGEFLERLIDVERR